MFVRLYVPKINSFSFPRFISNVSISIEDVNWKNSLFSYMGCSDSYKTLKHLRIYLDLVEKSYNLGF